MDKESGSIQRYCVGNGNKLGSLQGLGIRLTQVLEMSPLHQWIWAGTADGKLIMCKHSKEKDQTPFLEEIECYTGHPDEIKGGSKSTALMKT